MAHGAYMAHGAWHMPHGAHGDEHYSVLHRQTITTNHKH